LNVDYGHSAVGFLAKLAAGSAGEPEPQTTKRAPEPSEFRRVILAEGAVSGVRLARSCLAGGSTIGADVSLLLDEVLAARPGPARNHTMGRLAGFLGELDNSLAAIRAAGVTVSFAPLDEVGMLERLRGR
jgi:hypothetical protein